MSTPMSDGNPYRIAGPALVSFSGGRTSAFMLRHILEAHGGSLPADVHVCFANTGREMPETLDFVEECARRWSVKIVWLEYDLAAPHQTRIITHASASRDGEPFRAVIANRGFLPNPVTRFCTSELKIRRLKMFMHHVCGHAHWLNVVGLRADEMRRVVKLTDPARMARERWTNAGWCGRPPAASKCARMRSLLISDKGSRPWKRLLELGWTRRS